MEFTESSIVITHHPYGKKYKVNFRFDDSDERSLNFIIRFKEMFEVPDKDYGNSIGDCIRNNEVVGFIDGMSESMEKYLNIYVTCEAID